MPHPAITLVTDLQEEHSLAEEVTSLLITGLKLSLEFSSVLMLPL
jgi:hypothetical protein